MNHYQWTLIVFASFAAVLSLFRLWNRDTKGAFMLGILVADDY